LMLLLAISFRILAFHLLLFSYLGHFFPPPYSFPSITVYTFTPLLGISFPPPSFPSFTLLLGISFDLTS
jgi:hypothetical protein